MTVPEPGLFAFLAANSLIVLGLAVLIVMGGAWREWRLFREARREARIAARLRRDELKETARAG